MIAVPLDTVLGRGGAGAPADKQILSESPSFLQAPLSAWASVARKLQPAATGQKTAAMRLLETGPITATLSPKGSVVGARGKPGIQGDAGQCTENLPA